MADYNLKNVLKLSTNNEGGYSNHPRDPGGPTNHGITIATLRAHRGSATIADVKALSLDEANQIYVKNYWKPIWGDQLPAGLDYAVFDFGINSGPSRAVKTLQGLLPGCAIDGVMGPKTIAAVLAYDTADLIRKYIDKRMTFFKSLKTWPTFGRGWTYRTIGKDPQGQFKAKPGVLGDALAMVAERPITFLPMPLDELLPIAKARDSDIKVFSTITNKLQAGAGAAIGGAVAVPQLPSIIGGMLPQLQQARDTMETVKDVSQWLTYAFVALTVACVVATIMHSNNKAREAGLDA